MTLLLPLQRSLEVFCRRMLRNPADVEDVLQQAIMTAYARFDCYARGTNFRAWIFRFVTLEAFNRNRKRGPPLLGGTADDLPARQVDELTENSFDALVDVPDSVAEHFDDEVVQALGQLTPSERAVLLLRAIGEFSYKEMHEILSIPLGSVMGYLSRARWKMRHWLVDPTTCHGLIRRQESRS
jgi:RNA polymerase sigma-70 factor (ECF subfamily)